MELHYLKSNVFNIGTNDEELYFQAEHYALEKGWVTSDELGKITRVMDGFEKSQRNRIRGLIGKRESDVTIEKPALDGNGDPIFEKKTGKAVMTKSTCKANVDGAKILAMLAKMTEDEIKAKLNSSGASSSFVSDLKKTVNKVAATIENSEIKRDGDTLLSGPTWLERIAENARQRNNTI